MDNNLLFNSLSEIMNDESFCNTCTYLDEFNFCHVKNKKVDDKFYCDSYDFID